MDLKKLQDSKQEAIDVPLLFGEDGEPTDGFKVLGANSQEYQDADRALKQRNVQRNARRGRGIDALSKNGAEERVGEVGPLFIAGKDHGDFAGGLAEARRGGPAELNEE